MNYFFIILIITMDIDDLPGPDYLARDRAVDGLVVVVDILAGLVNAGLGH